MAESIAATLDAETVKTLAEIGKDWAQSHGLCIRLKDRKTTSDTVQFAPFSLVPSNVSRRVLNQAYDIQKELNLLYHRVAFDYEFISKSLISVVTNDAFTKKLLDIYTTVRSSGGLSQPAVLTIQRADYMFDESEAENSQDAVSIENRLSLKQVEVNNIASSFAGIGSKVSSLHVEMLRQLGHSDIKTRLPANQACFTVAQGLVEAWKHYNNPKSAVLFVVEEENQNVLDQRAVEYEMLNQTDGQVYVLYLTLLQCFNQLYVAEDKKLLTKDLKVEISVVYFRVGYIPQHFPTDNHWAARLMLEQSAAIKCPWIGSHLAGCKKIQQVLADPKVLARYVEDADVHRRIMDTFVGLYGLEKNNPETEAIVAKACTTPDKYVLKPQLEGGGNNFYGKMVQEKLAAMNAQEREIYILMDRINPVKHENFLVRPNEPIVRAKVVSELGIFGMLLGTDKNVLLNESGGHLLRTKPLGTDEGGVMAGASVLDSPYLV